MAETIRKRSEVPEEFTWDLTGMFASDEAWLMELDALKELPEKVAAYAGTLGKSAENLLGFFRLNDDISVRLGVLLSYASQKADQDTAVNKYQDFRGKAIGVLVEIQSAEAFSDPEIMGIPEETLDAFYEAEPGLKVYKRNIDMLKKQAAHVLKPELEALLARTGEMAQTPGNVNGMLLDADLKWPAVRDGKGEEHPLTNGSLVSLLDSSDREFRKSVFETYYHRLGEFRNTIAATLNGQFKALKFESEVRHYSSTLEASLSGHEVPTEVYTNLIDTVHANFAPMYRYVNLRKKMLGVPELHMYDVYTPIVGNVARKIPFDEAKSTVLEALSVLGEDYTDLLKLGFRSRWIDVYENEGKRSGAYSTDCARPHPYVLLNHKDTLDSMFTLAHEMGHALHSYHSNKYQPVNTADYVTFVAEVASTCNEVLLMRYLLGKTKDKNEKIYLLNHFLDSFKGTLYRQTMFAEFELIMGKMVENGEELTADALSEKYLELNRLYFGPDMVSDPEIALEWARIPHFFYDYYVFQYATGFSAACAIANRILAEGEPAVRDYKRFLSGGSSQDPISLLKIAGVDMGSPAPVASALKLFGELADEMEGLI